MSNTLVSVAIVGATGAVGDTMINILEERNFPVNELFPLASARSMGKTVEFNSKQYPIIDLASFDFSRCQLALFSAGSVISEKYVPLALQKGCFVVDNTSLFRNQLEIPLVVSEVNPDAMDITKHDLIANPNCSTMGMLVAVKPLHDSFGVKRMHVSTYQAVSGAGKRAIGCLSKQTMAMIRMDEIKQEDYPPFPCQIAFNLIPQIGDFTDNGYTTEEMKMVNESHKILDDKSIGVNVTCVRAPVFYGHSMTINLEFSNRWSVDAVRDALTKAPGVTLKDDTTNGSYPTPIEDGGGKDDVFVGRVRTDISNPKCVTFWLVVDNLRKGAALNSIQIAELALERGRFID